MVSRDGFSTWVWGAMLQSLRANPTSAAEYVGTFAGTRTKATQLPPGEGLFYFFAASLSSIAILSEFKRKCTTVPGQMLWVWR